MRGADETNEDLVAKINAHYEEIERKKAAIDREVWGDKQERLYLIFLNYFERKKFQESI